MCPDPINQLGFSKGAQTYDHILTLNTIVLKYNKLKSPVYAVFVDFRKAFKSVCREALFVLKLNRSNQNGKLLTAKVDLSEGLVHVALCNPLEG